MSCFARVASAVAVAVTVLGLPARPAAAGQLPAGSEGCPGDYIIGPEDVLEIAVWNNASLTRTVPVRPDGKISLPLLDDVHAAGLTAMQLREKVAQALVVYIPMPSVSVIVREIHSFKVTVMGQVKTPGRYELKDRATVLDVLALAGGFTDYADRGRIVVLRQEGATTRRIRFPYGNLGAENGGKNGNGSNALQDNFCVKPGDIILVP